MWSKNLSPFLLDTGVLALRLSLSLSPSVSIDALAFKPYCNLYCSEPARPPLSPSLQSSLVDFGDWMMYFISLFFVCFWKCGLFLNCQRDTADVRAERVTSVSAASVWRVWARQSVRRPAEDGGDWWRPISPLFVTHQQWTCATIRASAFDLRSSRSLCVFLLFFFSFLLLSFPHPTVHLAAFDAHPTPIRNLPHPHHQDSPHLHPYSSDECLSSFFSPLWRRVVNTTTMIDCYYDIIATVVTITTTTTTTVTNATCCKKTKTNYNCCPFSGTCL